jgi:D-methionine transport system ATP-binding protein
MTKLLKRRFELQLAGAVKNTAKTRKIVIELNHISKIYQQHDQTITALDDISLQIHASEIFGIIGKSGAGKSTLIHCINLLERPTTGNVRVANQELLSLSPKQLRRARQQIGMIFQQFNLLDAKTVWQNIAFPLQLAKYSSQEIQKIVTELLILIDLKDKKNTYPKQLSGGQKQRVAIARAIASQPKVLLCDEATSALDPKTTKDILQLLKSINQRYGITIVLITHEMEVIKQICDRVAVLEQGKIIEIATILDFFRQPQTAIGRQLVHTTLDHPLPEQIKAQIQYYIAANQPYLIWRIYFFGKAAMEPLIAQLIKTYQLEVNILQAQIELLHDQPLGVMLVMVMGKQEQIENAQQYLISKQIQVEVIAYANQ